MVADNIMQAGITHAHTHTHTHTQTHAHTYTHSTHTHTHTQYTHDVVLLGKGFARLAK